MATSPVRVPIHFDGKDNVGPTLRSIESSIIRFAGAVSAALTVFNVVIFPIRAAADFQQQLLEVQKTTGLSAEAIERLGDSIIAMSRELNVSAVDLAKIAAIAGQLGLAEQGEAALAAFTETAARFSAVLDVTVEEAANNLAKISNIFNIGLQESERISSAFNEVSNQSTASGQELLDIVNRLGNIGGIDLSDALGIAATGKDLGAASEVIGTSFVKVITNMQTRAEQFAQFMGVSTREWATAVERDAVGALRSVLVRLNEIDEGAAAAFSQTNFGGGRIFSIIDKLRRSLAQNNDLLAEYRSVADSAFNSGTSAIEEQDRVLSGLNANWVLLKNAVFALAEDTGDNFLGPITESLKRTAEALKDPDFAQGALAIAEALGSLLSVAVDVVEFFGRFPEVFTIGVFVALYAIVLKMVSGFSRFAQAQSTSIAQTVLGINSYNRLRDALLGVSLAANQATAATTRAAGAQAGAAAAATGGLFASLRNFTTGVATAIGGITGLTSAMQAFGRIGATVLGGVIRFLTGPLGIALTIAISYFDLLGESASSSADEALDAAQQRADALVKERDAIQENIKNYDELADKINLGDQIKAAFARAASGEQLTTVDIDALTKGFERIPLTVRAAAAEITRLNASYRAGSVEASRLREELVKQEAVLEETAERLRNSTEGRDSGFAAQAAYDRQLAVVQNLQQQLSTLEGSLDQTSRAFDDQKVAIAEAERQAFQYGRALTSGLGLPELIALTNTLNDVFGGAANQAIREYAESTAGASEENKKLAATITSLEREQASLNLSIAQVGAGSAEADTLKERLEEVTAKLAEQRAAWLANNQANAETLRVQQNAGQVAQKVAADQEALNRALQQTGIDLGTIVKSGNVAQLEAALRAMATQAGAANTTLVALAQGLISPIERMSALSQSSSGLAAAYTAAAQKVVEFTTKVELQEEAVARARAMQSRYAEMVTESARRIEDLSIDLFSYGQALEKAMGKDVESKVDEELKNQASLWDSMNSRLDKRIAKLREMGVAEDDYRIRSLESRKAENLRLEENQRAIAIADEYKRRLQEQADLVRDLNLSAQAATAGGDPADLEAARVFSEQAQAAMAEYRDMVTEAAKATPRLTDALGKTQSALSDTFRTDQVKLIAEMARNVSAVESEIGRLGQRAANDDITTQTAKLEEFQKELTGAINERDMIEAAVPAFAALRREAVTQLGEAGLAAGSEFARQVEREAVRGVEALNRATAQSLAGLKSSLATLQAAQTGEVSTVELQPQLAEIRGDNIETIRQQVQDGLKDIQVTIKVTGVEGSLTIPATVQGGFATGGYVRGPGTGTSDSILARISNGEYVIRSAAVRYFGRGLFDALNTLRVPRVPGFASGGMVGDKTAAPAEAGGMTAVTINIGGKKASLYGERKQVDSLISALRTLEA